MHFALLLEGAPFEIYDNHTTYIVTSAPMAYLPSLNHTNVFSNSDLNKVLRRFRA